MVVLARPRDPHSADLTLEEDDVTEDFLEKPYVELLGDTNGTTVLQRTLSARVRRRGRVGKILIHFIQNQLTPEKTGVQLIQTPLLVH